MGRLHAEEGLIVFVFCLLPGRTRQSIMARSHIRLGYGVHRVYSRVGIVRPPREILTRVGPDRSIPAFKRHPHPRGIIVGAVEGCFRRVRVLKHTPRHRRGLLRVPTIFTASKRAQPRPLDQRDTVLIPAISDPPRVHPLQVNVPLARLIPGRIGPARSLLLRTRYRRTQHLRRPSFTALLRRNKPCSRRNPKRSLPGETYSQHSHLISSARRRITKFVVVRTSYLLATTLVRRPLRATLRRLHDRLFPSL